MSRKSNLLVDPKCVKLITFSKDLLALLLLLSCSHFWPQKFPDHNYFLLSYSLNKKKKWNYIVE